MEELVKNSIEKFYKKIGIEIKIINYINSCSVVTYYATIDTTETTIKQVEARANDLSLFCGVKNINILLDYSNKYIVFEVPKQKRQILEYNTFNKSIDNLQNGLCVNVGMTTKNEVYNINLCKMPHLLIAGTTGSGKSMLINTMLISLFKNYSPYELQTLLIDPKQVEFSIYENIPHLYNKIVTTTEETRKQLANVLIEIDRRYTILKNNNVKSIETYNNINNDKMPYLLIVIDELADLFMQDKKSKLKVDMLGEKRIEDLICRIAQVGRACGVHLIVATQRPSSDIITGLIKANIPSRIALSVATATDSRIILDTKGAEKLQGNGDLLLKVIGNQELIRMQGAYISENEIETEIKNIITKNNKYIEEQQKKQQIEELTTALKRKELQQLQKKLKIQEETKEQQQLKKQQKKQIKNIIFNIFQYAFSLPRFNYWSINTFYTGLLLLW